MDKSTSEALSRNAPLIPYIAGAIADAALVHSIADAFPVEALTQELTERGRQYASHKLLQPGAFTTWPQALPRLNIRPEYTWWATHAQELVTAQVYAHRQDYEAGNAAAAAVLKAFVEADMPKARYSDAFWLSQVQVRRYATPFCMTPQFFEKYRPKRFDLKWSGPLPMPQQKNGQAAP